MKIIDAYVDWRCGLGNTPDLYITTDTDVDTSDLRYEQRGHLYFAEKDLIPKLIKDYKLEKYLATNNR